MTGKISVDHREARVPPGLLRLAYDRIVDRVEADPNGGCWLWPGASAGSYGSIKIRSDRVLFAVHRVTYWVRHGPIPPRMHVLHKCDVRLCCNPDHLFAGTQSDNLQDASRKGRLHFQAYNRLRKGALHPLAALTDMDIEALKTLHSAGFKMPYLASLFRISPGHGWKIIRGDGRA